MALALDTSGAFNQTGDGFVQGTGPGVSKSITTSTDNDIIVAVIQTVSINGDTGHGSHAEYNGYVTVSNVGDTGTPGLVWQRRSQTQYQPVTGTFVNVEVWWAHQKTHGAVDVTACGANYGDDVNMIVFAVSGCNTSEPWDTNAGLNQPSDGTSTTATASYSTTAANTFAFVVSADATSSSSGTGNNGFTTMQSEQDGQNATFELATAYVVNSSAVSGGTGGITWTGSPKTVTFIDALVAAADSGEQDPVGMFIDGSAVNTFSGASSGTVTLTTANTNDVIVVAVAARNNGSAAKTVSNVTASGLTFTPRQTYAPSDDTSSDIEYWYAIASAALTSKVITVTMSGITAEVLLQAFGINGANVSGNTWDWRRRSLRSKQERQ